jgi:hypothetical protein
LDRAAVPRAISDNDFIDHIVNPLAVVTNDADQFDLVAQARFDKGFE